MEIVNWIAQEEERRSNRKQIYKKTVFYDLFDTDRTLDMLTIEKMDRLAKEWDKESEPTESVNLFNSHESKGEAKPKN